MAKPKQIELPDCDPIPILYEDRAVMAIDKPAGWMLVPLSWRRTDFNLQAALISSIEAGDFWARSRNLRFLRFIHRLDAETSGVLLFGKSPGAVRSLAELFETRRMEKVYLAVMEGTPVAQEWTVKEKIGPVPGQPGLMRIDAHQGKPAETLFKVVATHGAKTLVEGHPYTGRTHQIRLHLAHSGFPVVGDPLYGRKTTRSNEAMALRAVRLVYQDPFSRKRVDIRAPVDQFLTEYGFG